MTMRRAPDGLAPEPGVQELGIEELGVEELGVQELGVQELGVEELSDDLLYRMLVIREVELTLLRAFSEGQLNGTTHACLGQEYIPVALSSFVQEQDFTFSNHRGHGHYLSRFDDVDGLLAEILGRESGVCRGVGGSQHLYREGRYLSTGVQGEHLSAAVGVASSMRRRATGGLAWVFMGDGTWGEGAVYEALNLAKLWSVPLCVIVENNGISQTTPTALQMAGTIGDRAAAFGIPHRRTDSVDVGAIRRQMGPLIEAARSEHMPCVLEFQTVRAGPHSKGDDTRTERELDQIRARHWYTRHAAAYPDQVRRLEAKASDAIAAAMGRVLQAPLSEWEPEPRPAHSSATSLESVGRAEPPTPRGEERVIEGLNRALHAVFARNDRALLLGEDLLDPYGGAFKAARGLSTQYPDRVVTMPLSEGCFVGVATGLSLSGYQPIVELMFGDFIGLAFDQIVNLATKSVTMYGRDVVLPLLIRCPVGGNRAYGPTHSQSLQKHFIGIPNLDLFELTPFHDPAPLLARILDGHRPAILFEDKVLYTATRRVGPTVDDLFALEHVGDFAVLSPVDRPRSVGACLIASGGTSLRCLEAVRELLIEDEVDCEVLVPQKLYPLDLAPVRDRLLRAERIYVVEESTMGGTWGAEVAKAIYDDCWSELHGPVGLIHSRDAIIPSARHLERKVLVQSSDICAAIRRDRARRPSSK